MDKQIYDLSVSFTPRLWQNANQDDMCKVASICG